MKPTLSLLLLVILCKTSFSQCPQTGTFNSQQAIDNFAIAYGNCSVLSRLHISGSDITNLNGLAGLKEVDFLDIDISNMPIKDLTGLNNLTTVTNGFHIHSSPGSSTFLESFKGLSGLTSIYDFNLTRLGPQFKSMSGLGNFPYFNYSVIRDCDGLTDLSGLEGVKSLFRISLSDCEKLESLKGLHNARIISGLFLGNNPSMKTIGLTGLEDLVFLYVTETGIVNLDGLENLKILSSINIADNPSLESIAALRNVQNKPWGLTIESNPNLDGCVMEFLCNAYEQSSSYVLSGNKGNCSSRSALLEACAVLPVTLSQFHVANENGVNTLQWTTLSELNSRAFEIEHSADGKDWRLLGSVASGGDSDSTRSYLYLHKSPNTGNNYYRLRMVDHDNTFVYSRIAHVYVHGPVAKVYPNPASDELKLALPDWDNVNLFQLLRADGKVVFEARQLSQKAIDVTKFAAGNYVLKITDKSGGATVHKVSLVR